MCGILWDTTRTQSDKHIAHRGLYSHRVVTDAGILTHSRLPIIDLSHSSDQPIENERWVFSFVGELINYKEFDSQARSDTWTMFKSWNSYGSLREMDGFWAIVAYDKYHRELHLVTDFLAKKPLYVHLPSGSVSTEIKPLLFLGPCTFDEYYFSTVRKFGYCMNEHTFVNEVIKVPPNAHWTISDKIIDRGTWGPPLRATQPNLIRPTIEKAVRERIHADVPVSLLLSGGLDSTIIFELMKKYTTDFTVYHVENGESDYLKYLDFPSGIKLKEITTTENIDEAVRVNEGPQDLGSMLPQYSLHQAIRKNNPETFIVMTGDGADELFGGYKRSMEYDSQLSDIYDELVYYHLPRLDKMSMAFTMELRSPYLSKDVIEAALSLKYSLRQNKRGLKMYFDDIINPMILSRTKVPLKSKQVLNQKDWRDELQTRFRRIMYEHYGCRNTRGDSC